MGYNAGGFGSMTFPDAARLAAWRKATVSHAAWSDWVDDLAATSDPDETVARRLARVKREHDARAYNIQEIAIAGTTVQLTYDTGEDSFHAGAGDLAALLRSADAHGAKGTFWFLGTAGGESMFVHELSLDGRRSKVKSLGKAAIAKVYDGKAFKAFTARARALQEAGNPELRRHLETQRQGRAPRAAGGALHGRVVAALAVHPDRALLAAARRFPLPIPDGKTGTIRAAKVFVEARRTRAMLANPSCEEHRGVALWTQAQLDEDTGLALEALSIKATDAAVRAAALHALVLAPRSVEAVDLACAAILAATTHGELAGAQAALLATKVPDAATRVAAVLAKMTTRKTSMLGQTPRASYVLELARRRDWTGLAGRLATVASSDADGRSRYQAAELALAWNDRDALAQLAPLLGDRTLGVLAARAHLALDPEPLLAKATTLAGIAEPTTEQTLVLYQILSGLEADQRAAKAAKRAPHLDDKRWVDLCLGLITNPAQAPTALRLLAVARREPRIVSALEKRLAAGAFQPLDVALALKGQGAKHVARLVAARLAKATDPLEKHLLEQCRRI